MFEHLRHNPMSKSAIILHAGKQIAAVASGRALKGETLKSHPEDSLNDPAAERQDKLATGQGASVENDGLQDPGNPNEVDHDDQDPGQEES